jgi:hypothetical protein
MPSVNVYCMSEKLDTQSNHYTYHTCTQLIAQGWQSDLGRVCKSGITSGWIYVCYGK